MFVKINRGGRELKKWGRTLVMEQEKEKKLVVAGVKWVVM